MTKDSIWASPGNQVWAGSKIANTRSVIISLDQNGLRTGPEISPVVYISHWPSRVISDILMPIASRVLNVMRPKTEKLSLNTSLTPRNWFTFSLHGAAVLVFKHRDADCKPLMITANNPVLFH